MSLTVGAESLTANSFVSAATGASAQFVPKNPERNGLLLAADPANTGTVYLLLGTGTASAVNYHIPLVAGGSWSGLISGVLWQGPVQVFSAAAQKLSVVEV